MTDPLIQQAIDDLYLGRYSKVLLDSFERVGPTRQLDPAVWGDAYCPRFRPSDQTPSGSDASRINRYRNGDGA